METRNEQGILAAENVIEISHLKKTFGTKEVLKDITLKLKRGESLVVLGKSGTGKSVLIKCIVGLIQPDSGDLNVLGQKVQELDNTQLDNLRTKIGFLFQSGALYDSMTVRENLEFPLERHLKGQSSAQITELVEEALENVGLKDAINKMPSELSGGMRKRISLARTLIMKPDIMLYDEPTTGLDPITSKEISYLILEMQKKYNTSSIIITHDMPCAKITANRVAILKEGIYLAEGTYDELEKSEDPWIRSFFENN
ncbi:MAG TPA: ABC transporter ATP-binding protein [Cytophagaceae bacterium]|jgi:phospholipid/cholesterol/gamma-HCH transport system ATP-binding protein